MALAYQVQFRGLPACPCLAEWLPAFEAELKRRGIIKVCIDIFQLIGGAPQSGGTHSAGGAFDIAQTQDEAIKVARQMGADATWHRPKNWDGKDGIEHTHGVLRGCPHNGPARYQIAAVDKGKNGLGFLGEAGPDTGPRPLSKRTWKQGIAWAAEQAKPKPVKTPYITAALNAKTRKARVAALQKITSPSAKKAAQDCLDALNEITAAQKKRDAALAALRKLEVK